MFNRVWISTGVLLVLFIVLAVLTTTGQLVAFDEAVSAAVHSWETPVLTSVLIGITTVGEWFVYVPIALVLLAIPKLRLRVGLPAAVTLAAVGVLNWALKQIFAVPRPDTHRLITETGFSFPSGHAMSAAAFVGIVVFLLIRYSQKGSHQAASRAASRTAHQAASRAAHLTARQTAALALAMLFILAVGFSRVYLGVHNPSDVIAGFTLGFFLCLLALGVLDVIEARR
jgi:undecaprenyl-diphosphatase